MSYVVAQRAELIPRVWDKSCFGIVFILGGIKTFLCQEIYQVFRTYEGVYTQKYTYPLLSLTASPGEKPDIWDRVNGFLRHLSLNSNSA